LFAYEAEGPRQVHVCDKIAQLETPRRRPQPGPGLYLRRPTRTAPDAGRLSRLEGGGALVVVADGDRWHKNTAAASDEMKRRKRLH